MNGGVSRLDDILLRLVIKRIFLLTIAVDEFSMISVWRVGYTCIWEIHSKLLFMLVTMVVNEFIIFWPGSFGTVWGSFIR